MAAVLMHRNGGHTVFTKEADLDDLLSELDGPEDPEHPDVAVTHESGWGLSAHPNGRVVWENVEVGTAPVGHRFVRDRLEVRRLFALVAHATLDQVHALDWTPGSGA